MIYIARNANNRPVGFQNRKRIRDRAMREAIDSGLSASQHWSNTRSTLAADADILGNIFNKKCAYCEAKLRHVSYAHIEHFLPKSKSKYLHLAYAWNNWLYSCQLCNLRKGTYSRSFDGKPVLIDPTKDDPEIHFKFSLSGQLRSRTSRGRQSIKRLDLNREDLVNERGTWIVIVMALALLQAKREQPLPTINELLAWCITGGAPYSAFAHSVLQVNYPQLLSMLRAITVPPGLDLRNKVRSFVLTRAERVVK